MNTISIIAIIGIALLAIGLLVWAFMSYSSTSQWFKDLSDSIMNTSSGSRTVSSASSARGLPPMPALASINLPPLPAPLPVESTVVTDARSRSAGATANMKATLGEGQNIIQRLFAGPGDSNISSSISPKTTATAKPPVCGENIAMRVRPDSFKGVKVGNKRLTDLPGTITSKTSAVAAGDAALNTLIMMKKF